VLASLGSGGKMLRVAFFGRAEVETMNHEKSDRITIDPMKMGGVPCIRHLRIPVATIAGLLEEGVSEAEILEDYPDLEPEDLRAAMGYTRLNRKH
jgi:uncharacterized protein (DUF433 family)